jgi:hypothetical protein
MHRSSAYLVAIVAIALSVSPGAAQQLTPDESTPDAGAVTGSGRPGSIPLWVTPSQLGNSVILQKGDRVAIGTKSAEGKLDVYAPAVGSPAGLIPAINAVGGSAIPGSDEDASPAIVAHGGNGDVDGTSRGGAGVVGVGGAQGLFGPAGAGGMFFGGGTHGDGIDATCQGNCYAGNFKGDLNVTGAITAGKKDFKIDDPLDPANKYLVHTAVESSEMKNIYDGTVVLDGRGEATVELPAWFEAENEQFRYQLTAIGAPSPGLFIAEQITDNRFKIAGGAPRVEVSWQVTGVRHDAYAQANPLIVEQTKDVAERGYYIHPELYGANEDRSIEWARNPVWREHAMARLAKAVDPPKTTRGATTEVVSLVGK